MARSSSLHTRVYWILLASSAAVAPCHAASAQEPARTGGQDQAEDTAAREDTNRGFGDIVVTAQKRAERPAWTCPWRFPRHRASCSSGAT